MGFLEKKIGFYSDPGNSSTKNEDSIICFSNDRENSDVEMVLGVADGMGGHEGGEVASNFITSELVRLFQQHEYKKFSEDHGVSNSQLPYLFKLALEDINKKLFEKRKSDSDKGNMGSTFTGALGYELELYLAHVGDVRAYRMRSGKMECLTHDHTIGARLMAEKGLKKEELPKEYFNVIYRSFGYRPYIKIDFKILKVLPNDFYLFCSDGLYEMVGDRQIFETVLRNSFDPQESCRALVKLAKTKGGMDNISASAVLYVNYMGLDMSKKEKTSRLRLD